METKSRIEQTQCRVFTGLKVSCLAVVLILAAVGPVFSDDCKSLEPVLLPYLKQYGLPALGAAAVKNGKLVAAGVVGVRKAGTRIPAKAGDRFHIGSDSKAFTSLLAAILVEEGKLGWETTLGEVYPELKAGMAPGVNQVTLKQLLSHSSGMVDNEHFVELMFQSGEQDGNLDELRYWLVSQWVKEPLVYAPGEKFAYSNMGYTMAGAIIERTGGKTWEQLVTERIFKPLELRGAGFGPQATLGKIDAPLGHMIENGRIKAYLAGPNGDNPLIMGPAGTIHMPLLAFARWAGWHAGEGRRGPALVRLETLKLLHTPVIDTGPRKGAPPGTPSAGQYALGWGQINVGWLQEPLLSHAGSNTKNLAVIHIMPKHDWAMVMMTNVGGSQAHEAFIKLAQAVYKRYLELK